MAALAKALFIVKLAGAVYPCWIGIKAIYEVCRKILAHLVGIELNSLLGETEPGLL